MSTNEAAPLTLAELDLLATLDAARTPGLLTAVSPHSEEGGQAIAHTGGCREGSERATSIRLLARGERDFIPTTQEQAEADARALVAALNALPALLAEVRAARSALRFGEHVRARDAEGRYVRGWIVALDVAGRVQLDIVTGASERSGHVTEWLDKPERCAVYVRPPSPFEPRIASSDDDDGPRLHIPADLLTHGPRTRC